MAATVRAQRVGRSSHTVNLQVPEGGDLLNTETDPNILKQQIRSDWATLVRWRSDTITSARITIVVSDGALTHDYTIATPAGQAPLGARDGDGPENSLAVLCRNYRANLENLRLRGKGGAILGVKQMKVFINADPETLALPDYDGTSGLSSRRSSRPSAPS